MLSCHDKKFWPPELVFHSDFCSFHSSICFLSSCLCMRLTAVSEMDLFSLRVTLMCISFTCSVIRILKQWFTWKWKFIIYSPHTHRIFFFKSLHIFSYSLTIFKGCLQGPPQDSTQAMEDCEVKNIIGLLEKNWWSKCVWDLIFFLSSFTDLHIILNLYDFVQLSMNYITYYIIDMWSI